MVHKRQRKDGNQDVLTLKMKEFNTKTIYYVDHFINDL